MACKIQSVFLPIIDHKFGIRNNLICTNKKSIHFDNI